MKPGLWYAGYGDAGTNAPDPLPFVERVSILDPEAFEISAFVLVAPGQNPPKPLDREFNLTEVPMREVRERGPEDQLEQSSLYPWSVLEGYAAAGKQLEMVLTARAAAEGWPEFLVIESSGGLPYFCFHKAWSTAEALPGTRLLLRVREPRKANALARSEPVFREAVYWQHRLEQFSARAADGLIGEESRLDAAMAVWELDESDLSHVIHLRDGDRLAPQALRKSLPRRQKARRFPPISVPAREYAERVQERISVVIPYFNMGQFIEEAVDSLMASSHLPEEVVIVNDGSDDPGSLEALERIEATHGVVRVIHQDNHGLGRTRVIGAEHARNDCLLFLDADDRVEPDFLKSALHLLYTYENIGLVTAWERYFGSVRKVWPKWDMDLPRLLAHNMTAPIFLVKRKTWLEQVSHHPDFDRNFEDFHAVLSMLESGALGVCLNEPLVAHRIRPDSRWESRTREQILVLHERIARHHKGLFRLFGPELFSLLNSNGAAIDWDTPGAYKAPSSVKSGRRVEDGRYSLKLRKLLRRVFSGK